jgi:crotonobetainyl-CoA:carnitine CoA-transferase CaiB-like acyl-CoA transferase
MAGYDFLKSVVVVEVAQLGMDALGGYLADMGARVIKVEALPGGDPVRYSGEAAIGGDEGVGFLHLRWNRGKQSIGLDLASKQGAAVFRRLAAKADVVIEGLKGGALDRLGLGFEVLRRDNPALVHCAISGLGSDGPYYRMRSHAVAYDAYGGLLPQTTGVAAPGPGEFRPPSIGMHAPGLFGAVGVLAALLRARESGEGAFLEVAAADVAANWIPDGVDAVVNAALCTPRKGFVDDTGRMLHWPRLAPYETSDGRILLLEALAWPTWVKFCKLITRDDLLSLHEEGLDDRSYHARLQSEIAAIIRARPLDEWMAALMAHDVSAMPIHDLASLASDPHYLARGNAYDLEMPAVGTLRLSGTPIRVPGVDFVPAQAPGFGEHSDALLADLLGMEAAEIADLRERRAIA